MATIEIPIYAGEEIAKTYGYDQVVIVARKVGGPEHVTTYGINPENCTVAAQIGNFFKHKLMQWSKPPVAMGVGRDTDNAKALVIYCKDRPTDDELRALHDLLRS